MDLGLSPGGSGRTAEVREGVWGGAFPEYSNWTAASPVFPGRVLVPLFCFPPFCCEIFDRATGVRACVFNRESLPYPLPQAL